MPAPFSFSSIYLGTSLLTGSGASLYYDGFKVGSGDYYPIANPSGYQTAANVTASLSPYLTSATAASTYGTLINLAATGATLNTLVTGSYYLRTNPSGFQTLANVSGLINTGSSIVRTTGNQIISGDKMFDGWISGVKGGINFKSGIYKESGTNITLVDFANKQLKAGGTGIVRVDWARCGLYEDFYQTVDWSGRRLLSAPSTYTSIHWGSGLLCDPNAGTEVLDWRNRYLKDSSSAFSVNWQNRVLQSGSMSVINWGDGSIYDTDPGRNEVSIQFTNRTLDNSNGPVLSWDYNTFSYSWDFIDGATSSNLGTDWSGISDNELVTKGAVLAGTKKSLSTNGLNLVYYGTAGRSVVGSVLSTQPAALCSSGSAHRLIFTVDAAGWAARTAKLAMIWTNSIGGVSHTIRFNCSIRTTALNGTNNYTYNAGNSDSIPFNEQFTSQVPSATASYLKYSESSSFTIPSDATAITMQVGFESIPSGTAYITEAQLIEV